MRKNQRRGRGDGIRAALEREEEERAIREERGDKMSLFSIPSRIIPQNCRDKGSSKD